MRSLARAPVSPCIPRTSRAALLAFDAAVRVRGKAGERSIPLGAFFAVPSEGRRVETRLGEDELILSVNMPSPPAETRSVYLKAMDRQAFSFALVGVAAVLRPSHARIVLSGVAPIPWRVPKAEALMAGKPFSAELAAQVAQAALNGAKPLEKNGYKVPLTQTLVRRALAKVCGAQTA